MNIEKMREEFEARFPIPLGIWWSAEGGKDDGRYMTEVAHVGCVLHQGRWEGWVASRAAIEVELPEGSWMGQSYPEFGLDQDQVVSAIESVGIKVKVKS